jgi:hypothetical protein
LVELMRDRAKRTESQFCQRPKSVALLRPYVLRRRNRLPRAEKAIKVPPTSARVAGSGAAVKVKAPPPIKNPGGTVEIVPVPGEKVPEKLSAREPMYGKAPEPPIAVNTGAGIPPEGTAALEEIDTSPDDVAVMLPRLPNANGPATPARSAPVIVNDVELNDHVPELGPDE